MTKAAVALKAWMIAKDKSQAEVADEVTKLMDAAGRDDKTALNQSTISSWVRGVYVPHGLAMLAVEAMAGIPVADWYVAADEKKPAA